MSNKEKLPPIQIDLTAQAPAYIQIMLQIQGQILRGELRSGDQLATVRQLAAELAINFNTVARAYRLLDRAGLITTQQGRGTYVLDSADAHGKLREEVLQEVTAQYLLEIFRLDFSLDEVQTAFNRQIEEWK